MESRMFDLDIEISEFILPRFEEEIRRLFLGKLGTPFLS